MLTIRERYAEAHGQPSVRSERMEAFHTAVAEGRADAVRDYLRRGANVNEPNVNGIPAVALAPTLEVAQALVDGGADVNQRDRAGYTPLMLQARDGRPDVIRLLLSKRADITARDPSTKRTALDIANVNGQEDAAKVLREASGAR